MLCLGVCVPVLPSSSSVQPWVGRLSPLALACALHWVLLPLSLFCLGGIVSIRKWEEEGPCSLTSPGAGPGVSELF